MMEGGEGGDKGQLGLAWALPGGICTLTQLHGDTDHRTAEGSQGSITGAITPEILILA